MEPVWTVPITPLENWQITCHEAGHAVLAVRFNMSFLSVERGDGAQGQLEACGNPLSNPDRGWSKEVIAQWQQFYAAGAAAELLLFGSYREYACSRDTILHDQLERMRPDGRRDGWAKDVDSAVKLLDRESIEKVAKKLDQERKLTDEEVYQLFGMRPPWWYPSI
jgi:hypothetical protein